MSHTGVSFNPCCILYLYTSILTSCVMDTKHQVLECGNRSVSVSLSLSLSLSLWIVMKIIGGKMREMDLTILLCIFFFKAHRFYSKHVKLFENEKTCTQTLESIHKLVTRTDVLGCLEATDFRYTLLCLNLCYDNIELRHICMLSNTYFCKVCSQRERERECMVMTHNYDPSFKCCIRINLPYVQFVLWIQWTF